MARKPTAQKVEDEKQSRAEKDLKYFRGLKPYMDTVAVGELHRHRLFTACVKASLCKCYEFNLVVRQDNRAETAFFEIGSLRGICEDLIFLRYIKRMASADREKLIIALMSNETATRAKLQHEFFEAVRPQQPVLLFREVDRRIAESEAAVRSVWNAHGWPKLKLSTLFPRLLFGVRQFYVLPVFRVFSFCSSA